MIGSCEVGVEIAVYAALVAVEVQLAHRAHAQIMSAWSSWATVQEPANQLERLWFADLRHVAAAAVSLRRIRATSAPGHASNRSIFIGYSVLSPESIGRTTWQP